MCKAQNFTCKICKKIGHFTSMCKAPMPERRNPQFRQNTRDYTQQQNTPQTRRVRHVKEQQNIEEDDEAENEETVDAEATLYIKKLMEDWSTVNTVRPTGPDTVNNVALSKESRGEFWVNTKCNDLNLDWLADTGSARSFIQYSKAQEIVDIHPESKITNFKEKTRYKCFNNQEINILGVLQITLKSGAWTVRNCNILLVNNLPQNVIGRNILRQLGIQLTATKPTGKKIGLISDIPTEQNIIKWILKKYPHLCTRPGRSKNHMAKSIFKENFTPIQHKGRRVPLHLLERVEQELEKLIEDKQIIRLENCSDEYFISPVVITVKKDKSIKIALDYKELNDAIHRNKYQLQSIDNLIDAAANYISEWSTEQGTLYFSKIDLKYVYSQIPLDTQLQKHCNFNILGGKATGTYRFINGFYGLTDMPATFQKTIDVTLRNCHNKFAFLDDIIVITKGSITDHEKELDKILYLLDKENLAIKLQKCEFARKQITWLGYLITPTGITPTKKKCESINKLETPKILKQLRSFMGCIHHLIKFTPQLAEMSAPVRLLLSKNNTKARNKLDWQNEHTIAFEKIKKQIINITENKHFDINKETRIKSDASKNG